MKLGFLFFELGLVLEFNLFDFEFRLFDFGFKKEVTGVKLTAEQLRYLQTLFSQEM